MILCYSPFSIVVIISGSINVDLKVIPTFSFTVVLNELVYQSIFVLLAYDRAQRGSF